MRNHRRSTLFNLMAGISLMSVLLFSGFGCKTVSKEVTERTKPILIKYWRVLDDEDVLEPVLLAYRAAHPNITIEYRKFRLEEYEDALLEALAQDQGPDVFSIHNTWMGAWQPRLMAAPPVLSVPFREIVGTIKKEVVYTIRQVPGPSLGQLANDFVDVVATDVVIPTEQADPRAPWVPRIYGLPLSVDTMVMYYNKDILNTAGIAQPATHWREFQEQVKKLTRLDEVGTIIQSGAAMGTTKNVERSSDLLALLMMQNGAPMTDENGMVAFDRYPPELAGRPYPPGAEALIFYSDFANPEKEVYTWNDKMPNSLEAFVRGQAAFFFGYSYHLPMIRQLDPKLNFAIAPFPQIEGNKPVNYANYWIETVSKKAAHPDEAWDFLMFLTKAESAQHYLNATKKPTALRSLVNSQLEDLDLSVFAAGVVTAKSWYHGTDAAAMEKAFQEMVEQMHAGEEPKKIVELGATKVNQTIK